MQIFDEEQHLEIRRGDEYSCKAMALWGTLIVNSGRTDFEASSKRMPSPADREGDVPIFGGSVFPGERTMFKDEHAGDLSQMLWDNPSGHNSKFLLNDHLEVLKTVISGSRLLRSGV